MCNLKVYHSSKISGLKIIEPRVSTHGKPWVYAAKNLATSAMFLGDNFDFICQTGVLDSSETPFIWERFEGAFETGYKNKRGSIYVLDGSNFKEGMTSWSDDLVAVSTQKVLDEIVIENVEVYLQNLGKRGELKIFYYPNTPEGSPNDKSDIIKKAVNWTIQFGEKTLTQLEKYHPDILEKVIEELQNLNYTFKSDSKTQHI